MTVDRTHVLATPGLDAHGSYVALSRHRDGIDLHYGRDDFAGQDRLVRTLSRDRVKDMASDYEPAQSYAERRSITFRERVAEIVRKVERVLEKWGPVFQQDARPQRDLPQKVRDVFDGLRHSADSAPGSDAVQRPERESAGAKAHHDSTAPARETLEDREAVLRRARTEALKRHARACDAILEAKRQGLTLSVEQRRELGAARRAFNEVQPHGWEDAEAAYSKDNSLAREAGSGRANRAIRALQIETEIRTDPNRRADRFVERWQKLDQASQRQYQAGDMSGYKSTRAAMGDMAKSLERDPQLESILAGRKQQLGIGFDSGRSLSRDLAFNHGIDLGIGRGIGL